MRQVLKRADVVTHMRLTTPDIALGEGTKNVTWYLPISLDFNPDEVRVLSFFELPLQDSECEYNASWMLHSDLLDSGVALCYFNRGENCSETVHNLQRKYVNGTYRFDLKQDYMPCDGKLMIWLEFIQYEPVHFLI